MKKGLVAKYIVSSSFPGLKSGVLPMSITILSPSLSTAKTTKKRKDEVKAFIELSFQQHFKKASDGKDVLKRFKELKVKLYHHHYPKIPVIQPLNYQSLVTSMGALSKACVMKLKDL
jgi:hypothetical protein